MAKRTLEDIGLMEVLLLTIELAYIATSVQVRNEEVEQRSIRDEHNVKESDVEVEEQRSLVTTKVWLLKRKN